MQPDIELPRRTEPQFEPPLFQPGQPTSSFCQPLPPFNTQPSVHTDKCDHGQLSKFLLKKDLLLSRLYKYDDRPETFPIWKQSFQTVLTELDVTPVEELDLLLKWLGTESRQYAVTIRAANIHDLPQGVKRIWERLEERYGTPEQIESAVSKKLSQFPNLTNKDNKKLYELADIAAEIESLKENPRYSALLAVYDSSSGVNNIVMKLPHSLREKWVTRAAKYKAQHEAVFPPFKELVKFLNELARIKNDPGLMFDHIEATHKTLQQKVFSRKTEVNDRVQSTHGPIEERHQEKCPIHKTRHSLRVCNAFKAMNQENKKQLLKENKLCFRCLSPSHMYKNCITNVKCEECGSDRHCTVKHFTYKPRESHGREETKKHVVASKCTSVCGNAEFKGKSCATLVLVNVYKKNQPQNQIKVYAVIDDQSNRFLAGPELFDLLDLNATMTEYTLGSCSGQTIVNARIAEGCVVASLDNLTMFEFPSLLECQNIPNVRSEIPTPEVAISHSHLRDVTISPLDNNAKISILIGRDLLEAHHVLDQKIGPRGAPYAQKLPLGWVIVAEACLGNIHRSDYVNVKKTYLFSDGRESVLTPCHNGLHVYQCPGKCSQAVREDAIFKRTRDDNKPGLSNDDREFMAIMGTEFKKETSGKWFAPLPFRKDRPRLPNNRVAAERRAKTLDYNLRKDENKRKMFTNFMEKVFENGHAELAPTLLPDQECWYLQVLA